MTLSEFYASTIVRVRVSFGFWEFDGDPDEITTMLGIQPDEVLRKGSPRGLRGGRTIPTPINGWTIQSRSPSKDVNDHIRELIQRVAPVRDRMRELPPPTFGVLWQGSYLYAGSGPFYEADVIKGMADLGAGLDQDIYQIDEEKEEEEDAVRA